MLDLLARVMLVAYRKILRMAHTMTYSPPLTISKSERLTGKLEAQAALILYCSSAQNTAPKRSPSRQHLNVMTNRFRTSISPWNYEHHRPDPDMPKITSDVGLSGPPSCVRPGLEAYKSSLPHTEHIACKN